MALDVAQPPTTQTPRKAQLRRVSAIDGLRGLAVLSVVLYHFFGTIAPGGFLGVDMFFVLSGFLITSLLLREYAVNSRIDLRLFWLRRARRILPAAIVVLVIGTAAAGLVGGDPAVGLKPQFIGTLAFVNNWMQIAGSESYFADFGVQIFAHYWSLAVEEQFYVLFPLLVVVLLRQSRAALIVASAGLCCASYAAMQILYSPELDPTRVYYGTDTHSFGLLIGVLLACFTTSTSADPHTDSWPVTPTRHAPAMGIVGLIGLVALVCFTPDTSAFTYRGGLLAASLFTMMLLYSILHQQGPAHAFVNTKSMRWLGKISFSLYLWHWPVYVIITALTHHPVRSIIALVASLSLAHLSYTWVETPIRRHGYRHIWNILRPKPRLIIIGTGITLLMTAGIAIIQSPNETALERQLKELSAAATTTTAAPAGPANVVKLSPGPHPVPDNAALTAIGDSVMLASSDALKRRYPHIHVDAQVSRNIDAAPDILRSLDAKDALDPIVILGFGTNAELDLNAVETTMTILGPDRIAILVTPFGDRPWILKSHDNIRTAHAEYPNLYIADWCGKAQADPAILHDDEIHPTDIGAEKYTEAITQALVQWANHRNPETPTCDKPRQ